MVEVDYHTPEQSNVSVKMKAERPSRLMKDKADMDDIESFFVQRGIFSNPEGREKSIMNLATGLVAPATTNVDKTKEIGQNIIDSMYLSENLKTFKIKKATLAKQIPLPTLTIPSASGGTMKYARNVDPQLYLQRILSIVNSDTSG